MNLDLIEICFHFDIKGSKKPYLNQSTFDLVLKLWNMNLIYFIGNHAASTVNFKTCCSDSFQFSSKQTVHYEENCLPSFSLCFLLIWLPPPPFLIFCSPLVWPRNSWRQQGVCGQPATSLPICHKVSWLDKIKKEKVLKVPFYAIWHSDAESMCGDGAGLSETRPHWLLHKNTTL